MAEDLNRGLPWNKSKLVVREGSRTWAPQITKICASNPRVNPVCGPEKAWVGGDIDCNKESHLLQSFSGLHSPGSNFVRFPQDFQLIFSGLSSAVLQHRLSQVTDVCHADTVTMQSHPIQILNLSTLTLNGCGGLVTGCCDGSNSVEDFFSAWFSGTNNVWK